MVGATKSSRISLRFRFHIEDGKTVASDVFDISISNTSDSALHYHYRDGDTMSREYEDLARRRKQSKLTREEEWKYRRLELERQDLGDYPFQSEQRNPRFGW